MNKSDINTPNPWLTSRTRTGAEYDAPFEARAKAGIDIHGEANLVERLLRTGYNPKHKSSPYQILDAGCGTGRMAIELAHRGFDVIGVDLDNIMLAHARAKAPDIPWILSDLQHVKLDKQFDMVVMAGNVMIFLTPNTEAAVLANLKRHLKPGGLLLAAFELSPKSWTQLTSTTYEDLAASIGLIQIARWSTWEQDPWQPEGSYLVSLHQNKDKAEYD